MHPGKDAYLIAASTWLLPPATVDPAKKTALTQLLRWVLTSGQKECASLGYTPLSLDAVDSQLRSLNA